jgi:hypothetical protein
VSPYTSLHPLSPSLHHLSRAARYPTSRTCLYHLAASCPLLCFRCTGVHLSYLSQLLPLGSHVKTTRPPSSSSRLACLLISVMIGSTQLRVHYNSVSASRESVTISARWWFVLDKFERRFFPTILIPNRAASASVRCLPSVAAFVFQPFRSFHIAPTPKLASLVACTNSVICYSLLGNIRAGICKYL